LDQIGANVIRGTSVANVVADDAANDFFLDTKISSPEFNPRTLHKEAKELLVK
jgi:hypothetical protein